MMEISAVMHIIINNRLTRLSCNDCKSFFIPGDTGKDAIQAFFEYEKKFGEVVLGGFELNFFECCRGLFIP